MWSFLQSQSPFPFTYFITSSFNHFWLTIFYYRHLHHLLQCKKAPPISMDAANIEAQSLLKEKTINDCFAEDDMDNDMMEEEEGSGDCYADDDRKKKVTARRGTSPPCCVVEKCGTNLRDAKRYHKRHKVCEVHSKAPIVIVAGLRQRFCQQCSRFHELSEFDESKRSCRRRLAGHNERRRKSTAETTGEGPSDGRADEKYNRPQIPIQGSIPYKHSQIR